MSFHNTLLPEFISDYLIASPRFNTNIVRTKSEREIRSSNIQRQLTDFTLQDCYLSEKQFNIFNAFFRARLGQKFSFLLKDPSDYKIEKQILKPLDTERQKYQIVKRYIDDVHEVNRIIKRIKIEKTKVKLSNEQEVGYEIVDGIINFNQTIQNNVDVEITTEYYLEVRFAEDNFDYSYSDDGSIKINSIKIIEV